MKGRIVSRPLPVELHSCPTPMFISRWLRRMKEGTVWECSECREQWKLLCHRRLSINFYERADWTWTKLNPTEQAAYARQRLDNTAFSGLLPVLDPGDPGPIHTSKRRMP